MSPLPANGEDYSVSAAFEESGKWSREQRGVELAGDDAKRCLALIARRQPYALHGKQISDLLDAATLKAASEADPDDPEFVAEYADECGRAASRIMRPSSLTWRRKDGRRAATLDGLGRSEELARY